ncbi:MAG: MBL fold metallo-hydrolase [Victivallales bacterium]|nr:MBL fold metallo-hydrolase [Victivallales bacterium]MBT7164933.1 MBL fold metallo-hydrolase [Victivallales bacterium]
MRWMWIIAVTVGIGTMYAAPVTLDEVRPALLARPATVGADPQRQALLASLDSFIKKPNSERSAEVATYYQGMIDHALAEIASTEVTEGVVVWKFYSCALVVKTPKAVFGIDLDEGPNSGNGNPDRVAGLAGIKFHMTAAQRATLAKLVDVSFHSHRHHDHVNYQITEALVAAGKTVVVPEDIRTMWRDAPFVAGLTVLPPQPGHKHRVGDLQVEVLGGRQWMARDHSSVCPCNAYLITTDNGVTVLFKGDINNGDQMLPWLRQVKTRGEGVDLYVTALFFAETKDTLTQIRRLFDPFLIPGHEYEFTHRKRGEAGAGTGSYSSQWNGHKSSIKRGKAVILSWGEKFQYLPRKHRQATSPLAWIELSPEPKDVKVARGGDFTVRLNATAGGTAIKRWYLAFKKTDTTQNLPGFAARPWGAILHDADGDGVFQVSTRGWKPGRYTLDCTADDWPVGSIRATGSIKLTVGQ